jgi:hypothetical protein
MQARRKGGATGEVSAIHQKLVYNTVNRKKAGTSKVTTLVSNFFLHNSQQHIDKIALAR